MGTVMGTLGTSIPISISQDGVVLSSSDLTPLGHLTVHLTHTLRNLVDNGVVLELTDTNLGENSAVSLTLYGPADISNDIGWCLAKNKCFLQHPFRVRDGIRYHNPHVLELK